MNEKREATINVTVTDEGCDSAIHGYTQYILSGIAASIIHISRDTGVHPGETLTKILEIVKTMDSAMREEEAEIDEDECLC